MDIAVALVSARLPKTIFSTEQIHDILGHLDNKNSWDWYSKAWILSKYGSQDELMELVETSVSLWVTQEHLSRLAASLFPRFLRSTYQPKFKAIIGRAGNAWSMNVLRFHEELSAGTNGYTAIKNFVLAKNPSLPNYTTHSKFMMLLSLLRNAEIAPSAVGTLKKVHAVALGDPYYLSM